MSLIISACATPSEDDITGFYIEGGSTSVKVPFELIDNRNFVDVYLDKQGPFKFILDTGGGEGILISPEVAQILGAKVAGSKLETGAGAEKVEARLASVAEVQLGSLYLQDVQAAILSLDKIQHAIGFERFDGIIGHEIFSRFVTTIDFENNLLQLTLPKHFKRPPNVTSIPLTIDGAPYVQANIGSAVGRFLVDTGDRSSLSFCGPFTDKFALLELVKPRLEIITGWGVGGPIPGKVGLVKEFHMGSVTVTGVVARFPTLRSGVFARQELAGLIGNGILKKFLVTFDYGHAEMLLTPNKKSEDKNVYDRSGMWIAVEKESIKILDIAPGTPAIDSKIAVGDIIEQVDGHDVHAADIFALRNKLSDSKVVQVQLRLRNDQGSRDTTVKLRDLI